MLPHFKGLTALEEAGKLDMRVIASIPFVHLLKMAPWAKSSSPLA